MCETNGKAPTGLPYLSLVAEISDNEKAFEATLRTHFRHKPTEGQDRLFHAFTRFVYSSKSRCVLLLKGYAGTGKTTSVSSMVRALASTGIRSILLAPTGRAAKVLGNYSGRSASTIHRQIYTRKMGRDGGFYFDLRENEESDTVFFVDEASMIGQEKFNQVESDNATGDLLGDLVLHVFSGTNCRLVLLGDDAQLPPIGAANSPALDISFLRKSFDLTIAEIELTEVIRQQQDSGILANATYLRTLIGEEKNEWPAFEVNGFADVQLIRSDPQPFVEEAYQRYGIDSVILITRSNKRANLYNQQIRGRILYHEEEINSGDRMMVLRNNYFWLDEMQSAVAGFIANGDAIEITRVRSFEDRGSFRFCRATVRLIDYETLEPFDTLLLCTTIWEETPSLSHQKSNELFQMIREEYAHLGSKSKIRKAMQQDEYYNALQVKFAYAITCHKAQGGQWPCVLVDQGYITDEMKGRELNRWMYTAITRASQELLLAGFDERFIPL